LLKMSLNDVNKLGTIAYEEVVHVKRAFHTGGYTSKWLANHMRDDVNIHEDVYRLHDSIESVSLSKLLGWYAKQKLETALSLV